MNELDSYREILDKLSESQLQHSLDIFLGAIDRGATAYQAFAMAKGFTTLIAQCKGSEAAEELPPSFVEFNINDFVWVQLTQLGREKMGSVKRAIPPQNDEGWSRWQLHELMNVFGDLLCIGGDLLFKTAIRLDCPR